MFSLFNCMEVGRIISFESTEDTIEYRSREGDTDIDPVLLFKNPSLRLQRVFQTLLFLLRSWWLPLLVFAQQHSCRPISSSVLVSVGVDTPSCILGISDRFVGT